MPNGDLNSLPFLTRKMLKFEHGAAFSLEITLVSVSADPITIRGFTSEGPFVFSIIPGTTAVKETFSRRIPDIPIFLSVTRAADEAAQNMAYVMVELGINGNVSCVLCQGYPNGTSGISWPYTLPITKLQDVGEPIVIAVADPAAGVNWNYTVLANQFLLVKTVTQHYTANATAANRRLILTLRSGANYKVAEIPSAATIVASQDSKLTWLAGGAAIDDQIGLYQTSVLPDSLFLPPDSLISVAAINKNAADQHYDIRIYAQRYFAA